MKKFNKMINNLLLEFKVPNNSVVRSDGELLYGQTGKICAHVLRIKYPKNCPSNLKQIIDKLNEIYEKLPTNLDSKEYQESAEAKQIWADFEKYEQLYAEATVDAKLEYDELPGLMKIPEKCSPELKKYIELYNKCIKGMDDYKDNENIYKQYKDLADSYYNVVNRFNNREVEKMLKSSVPVTVTCYDRTKVYPSAEAAIKYFEEGLANCDPGSSEAERYSTIISKLESGKTIVNDDYWD